MQEISPSTTDLLFALIKFTKELTVSNKEIDLEKSIEFSETKNISSPKYRKCIRYYSDFFLGFIHDGYDYSKNVFSSIYSDENNAQTWEFGSRKMKGS